VHAFFQDGVELSGYPRFTAPASGPSMTTEPIMDVLDNGSADVLIGTPATQGYAWTNFGVDVPGWPTPLVGQCWVSAATGDIDGDGHIEAVLGSNALTVFDLGADIQRSPSLRTWWWPMFGYNPQRQHCLACGRDAVTDVPPSVALQNIRLGPSYPNPTRGSVNFTLDLSAPGFIRVTVRDITGREVRRLVEGWLPAGRRVIRWDGRDDNGRLSSAGVYYAQVAMQVASGTTRLSRATVLLR
jgi:hypothetical protein